jgi:hypothetical protein
VAVLHPSQSDVQAFIYTSAGWLHGTLHIPSIRTLMDFLNAPEKLLKLTEVRLPGIRQPQPFLALQKRAAWLLIPQPPFETIPPDPVAVQRELRATTCLLGTGSINGLLNVPKAMRTSDFLVQSPAFVPLTECHLGPALHFKAEQDSADAWPLMLVNMEKVIGFTE